MSITPNDSFFKDEQQVAPSVDGSFESQPDIDRESLNLRRSMLDGGFYGVMIGTGETYLPAFALAIGLGEVVSGLGVSLPIFFGGIVQLVSVWALPIARSYKRWIVAGVTIQALAFIPLIIAAIVGSISAWVFFTVVAVYWGAGMAASPAWNTWIAHIVPEEIRTRFFARRTRWIQIATLASFLIAGVLLQWTKHTNLVLVGYASLFTCACIARLACSYYLIMHCTDRIQDRVGEDHQPLFKTFKQIPSKAKWLVLYLVSMQACVQFSGPYFVPYMIKQLHYSYAAFAVAIATAYLARILSMSLWGKIAKRYGAERLLVIGGLGLLPLSSLWVISTDLRWVVFVQCLSGLMWSAYELAYFLMFLDEIPSHQRSSALTLYNLANSATWCVGALAGGLWISTFGPVITSYHSVFIISSLTRCLCVYLLWRLLRAKRDVLSSSTTRRMPSNQEIAQAESMDFTESTSHQS